MARRNKKPLSDNDMDRIAHEKVWGKNPGARFSTGGSSHVTVNPTSDPLVPGGHYVSVGDDTDHSTAVYKADGTMADVKANRDWSDSPRQD